MGKERSKVAPEAALFIKERSHVEAAVEVEHQVGAQKPGRDHGVDPAEPVTAVPVHTALLRPHAALIRLKLLGELVARIHLLLRLLRLEVSVEGGQQRAVDAVAGKSLKRAVVRVVRKQRRLARGARIPISEILQAKRCASKNREREREKKRGRWKERGLVRACSWIAVSMQKLLAFDTQLPAPLYISSLFSSVTKLSHDAALAQALARIANAQRRHKTLGVHVQQLLRLLIRVHLDVAIRDVA